MATKFNKRGVHKIIVDARGYSAKDLRNTLGLSDAEVAKITKARNTNRLQKRAARKQVKRSRAK